MGPCYSRHPALQIQLSAGIFEILETSCMSYRDPAKQTKEYILTWTQVAGHL